LIQLLIIKTGALGDVLRTTSILPGLAQRYPDARITWVTAPEALDLLRSHPALRAPSGEVLALDPRSATELAAVTARLAGTQWERVISLDDEEPLCRLASSLPARSVSGAHLREDGARGYTPDVAPWFDMGLLSVHGKAVADRLKRENRRSHPQILAEMLGLAMGKPMLVLEAAQLRFAEGFARRTRLRERGAVVGLNTGAGGRWTSKALPVERTVESAVRIDRELDGRVSFVLFGGPEERERNARIAAELAGRARLIDAGVDNALLDFAALIGSCDVLITSDSLALHVALARDVRVVAFFAPTSAAEIELYGLGEKVVSTAPDYCSYRPDADTSTLTPERIAAAAVRQLRSQASLAQPPR
jgi:heptosyltransferase-2